MSLNEIRQLLTYKDKPEKNCSDVNELIELSRVSPFLTKLRCNSQFDENSSINSGDF